MNASDQATFLRCPRCGGKTRTRVFYDTVLRRFPLFCPKCRFECVVAYTSGHLTLSKEPDATVQ